MAKKHPKWKRTPSGLRRAEIVLSDEAQGPGFQVKFLPGGRYDHGSVAHQFGRLLMAELHKQLKAHGWVVQYETNAPAGIADPTAFPDPHVQPPAEQPSPLILPPGVRVH